MANIRAEGRRRHERTLPSARIDPARSLGGHSSGRTGNETDTFLKGKSAASSKSRLRPHRTGPASGPYGLDPQTQTFPGTRTSRNLLNRRFYRHDRRSDRPIGDARGAFERQSVGECQDLRAADIKDYRPCEDSGGIQQPMDEYDDSRRINPSECALQCGAYARAG